MRQRGAPTLDAKDHSKRTRFFLVGRPMESLDAHGSHRVELTNPAHPVGGARNREACRNLLSFRRQQNEPGDESGDSSVSPYNPQSADCLERRSEAQSDTGSGLVPFFARDDFVWILRSDEPSIA